MSWFSDKKKWYINFSFILLFITFAGSFVVDLVLSGGDLNDLYIQNIMSRLILGITGLVGGYLMLMADQPKTKTERMKIESESVLEGVAVGFVLFIGLTILVFTMDSFSVYQDSVRSAPFTGVLSAAPFEESFYRLLAATAAYTALIAIVPMMRYYLSLILSPILALIGIGTGRPSLTKENGPLNRGIAIILASILVSIFFVAMHVNVANIYDPAVFRFYFINAFFYTVVYLITRNILASTIAHLLHNGAVYLIVMS